MAVGLLKHGTTVGKMGQETHRIQLKDPDRDIIIVDTLIFTDTFGLNQQESEIKFRGIQVGF